MNSRIIRHSLTLLPLLLAACSGESSTASGSAGAAGSGSGEGGSAATCVSEVDTDGNLVLRAAAENNYGFSSTLTVSVTTVAANSELFIDWSGLTEDFVHHEVDPLADIDQIALLVWNIPVEEVSAKLNADDLGASDVDSAAVYYTENAATSASVFDFVVPGGGELPRDELMARLDPDVFPPDEHAYTIMPIQGSVLGQGVKMVQALRLDPTSTNQTITVSPDSTSLTYAADLTSLTPVALPAATSSVVVDWSSMTENGMGREWVIRSIDEVMVGYYENTPTELEADFLDLELIANKLWRGTVEAGDSLSLSALTDDAGQPFPGIDSNSSGTWILALFCGECGNPAPWYLTRLVACSS